MGMADPVDDDLPLTVPVQDTQAGENPPSGNDATNNIPPLQPPPEVNVARHVVADEHFPPESRGPVGAVIGPQADPGHTASASGAGENPPSGNDATNNIPPLQPPPEVNVARHVVADEHFPPESRGPVGAVIGPQADPGHTASASGGAIGRSGPQSAPVRTVMASEGGAVGGTDDGPGEAGGRAHCRGCGNTECDLFCADCQPRPRPETNSPTSAVGGTDGGPMEAGAVGGTDGGPMEAAGGAQCIGCGDTGSTHSCPCQWFRLCRQCLLDTGPYAKCYYCGFGAI